MWGILKTCHLCKSSIYLVYSVCHVVITGFSPVCGDNWIICFYRQENAVSRNSASCQFGGVDRFKSLGPGFESKKTKKQNSLVTGQWLLSGVWGSVTRKENYATNPSPLDMWVCYLVDHKRLHFIHSYTNPMACFESSESTSESTRQFRLNGCDLFRWNKPLNEMKIFIICTALTERGSFVFSFCWRTEGDLG